MHESYHDKTPVKGNQDLNLVRTITGNLIMWSTHMQGAVSGACASVSLALMSISTNKYSC